MARVEGECMCISSCRCRTGPHSGASTRPSSCLLPTTAASKPLACQAPTLLPSRDTDLNNRNFLYHLPKLGLEVVTGKKAYYGLTSSGVGELMSLELTLGVSDCGVHSPTPATLTLMASLPLLTHPHFPPPPSSGFYYFPHSWNTATWKTLLRNTQLC